MVSFDPVRTVGCQARTDAMNIKAAYGAKKRLDLQLVAHWGI